jgi:hypothetical protein
VVSFLQVSPPKTCINLSSLPYTLHVPPISFFWILSHCPPNQRIQIYDEHLCYIFRVVYILTFYSILTVFITIITINNSSDLGYLR